MRVHLVLASRKRNVQNVQITPDFGIPGIHRVNHAVLPTHLMFRSKNVNVVTTGITIKAAIFALPERLQQMMGSGVRIRHRMGNKNLL